MDKYRYSPEDVTLQLISYSFDGFASNFYSSLLSGGKLIIISKELILDYRCIVEIINKRNVTNTSLVPAMYRLLLDNAVEKQLESLRFVVLAGEAASASLVEKSKTLNPWIRLINEYGPTEATVTTVVNTLMSESGTAIIGRPIANNRIYILSKYLKLQPVMVLGELCISGIGITRGYLNNPEMTSEKFIELSRKFAPGAPAAACLYRTSDLARWLPDGNIEFLGRIDHQVKIRGFRIELGEIESRLSAHPEIKEAVVLCPQTKDGDHALCAYYAPANMTQDTEPDYRQYLAQSLPDYMIPSFFIKLETIPLTTNGKVDRKALSQLQISNIKSQTYSAPRNDIEEKLTQMWAEILAIPQRDISIDDDFFQKGGHSLKATIMVSRIHKEFNVKLPLAEIFKTPFIRSLANMIKRLGQDKYTSMETAEKKDYYVLSSAQKRLYILQQMDMQSTAYNMHQIIPLSSVKPVVDNLERLEDVFRKLIRRHDSLRTSFHIINETPVQVVHHEVPFVIEPFNPGTSGLRPTQPEFFRPFELSLAPLLRVGVIKGEGTTYLLIDMHHIITDGTSQELLVKEFFAIYSGETLPPLKLQYKDYAEWQNSKTQKSLIKQQAKFWEDTFSGELPVLNLPLDYPRPQIQRFEGSTVLYTLNTDETKGLREISKENETTLYMTMLSIFTIMLSKLCHREDIIVGTPVAARRHADLENILGMFVNTLSMRNYPNGRQTIRGYLKEVKERTLKAFENQEYPFEDLVGKIAVNRDTSRNPLFDVMFNLLNREVINGKEKKEPDDTNPLAAVDENFPVIKHTSKFDLTLNAFDVMHHRGKVAHLHEDIADGNIYLQFEYCTKLLKEDTIRRFITYFKEILQAVTHCPELEIAHIEIISEAEKEKILYQFNDTTTDYPKDKTLHQLFEEQVERTPDSIGSVGKPVGSWQSAVGKERIKDNKKIKETIEDKENTIKEKTSSIQLTYRELNETTDRLARHLQEKGAKPGTIVAIMLERSIETIIATIAILKTGAAYLPIEPAYPTERINYILKDSSTKIVLTGFGELKELKKLDEEIEFIDIHTTYQLLHSTGTQHQPASHQHPSGIRQASFPNNQSPITNPLAYIIYTSGSTGRPKGVMIEHTSVVNILTAMQRAYPLKKDDTYLFKTSYVFDVSVTEIFGWFLGGGRLAVLEKDGEKDPRQIIETIKKHRITHINFVPSMFGLFVETLSTQTRNPGSLSQLRYIFLAGEALSPVLVERYRQFDPEGRIQLENIYGPTEGTIYASRYPLTEWRKGDPLPIGKPMGNVNLYIFDKYDNMQPVGVPGELIISGTGLARGYLNKPELTGERFVNYKLQATNYKAPAGHPLRITKSKIQITNKKQKTKKENEPEKGRQSQLPRTALQNKSLWESRSPTGAFIKPVRDGLSSERVLAPGGAVPPRVAGPPEARFYRTGDLARWLPDGNVEFLGRIDHQVKIRGFRIEMGEIESRLVSHPGIKEAVVLVKGTGYEEQYLCACIVPCSDGVEPAQLREYLFVTLPDYMIPGRFVTLEQIPLTTSGKVDRKALAGNEETRLENRSGYTPPGTKEEKQIAEVWREVLT
ncbi:MAG: amino acid adenylation domain-containing protein, partial [bacterium]|nr:amino acid adenylation domain-containing protein [bacterium]